MTAKTYKLINGAAVRPGFVYLFRSGDCGPRPIRILNPGPLGQTYGIWLDEAGREIPGGWLALDPYKELWEIAD